MDTPKTAEQINMAHAAYGSAIPGAWTVNSTVGQQTFQPFIDWQDRELKLQCLKLVSASAGAPSMIDDAQLLYEFIVGKKL